ALPGARRLILAPLSPAQIARLIGATPQGDGAARKILRRLAHAYDLADLVRRPLLLGMVLQSLDALDPSARINATDVFNTYIGRWEQDGDLPIAAAEALA